MLTRCSLGSRHIMIRPAKRTPDYEYFRRFARGGASTCRCSSFGASQPAPQGLTSSRLLCLFQKTQCRTFLWRLLPGPYSHRRACAPWLGAGGEALKSARIPAEACRWTTWAIIVSVSERRLPVLIGRIRTPDSQAQMTRGIGQLWGDIGSSWE
jgi:hypothetical protein